MPRIKASAVVLATTVLVLLSCSGNDKSPTTPDLKVKSPQETKIGNTALWGLWDITLNPQTGTAEITPLRTAEFTMNMVKYLQPPADGCIDIRARVEQAHVIRTAS